jgi:hypothetical protein
VEPERSLNPERAEPDAPRGTPQTAPGSSSVLGAVGNRAMGRLLATPDGARALQRLTFPRPLARWNWGWETPKLAPDEPLVIERDFQLDPHMFANAHPSAPKADDAGSQAWVKGQWSTPDFTGEQQASVTEITQSQLYDEIGKVAPGLSRALRCSWRCRSSPPRSWS